MATFLFLLGYLQLPALRDPDSSGRLVTRSLGDVLDFLHNVISLKNLAEHDVAAIKPAAGQLAHGSRLIGVFHSIPGDNGSDKELRSVGVLSGVGHACQGLSVSYSHLTPEFEQRYVLKRPGLVWRSLKFSSGNLSP